MDIEILTICDSAHNYQDKMFVVAPFKEILAESCPFTHSMFSLACRLNYTDSKEAGTKDIKIALIDEKGYSLVPTINSSIIIPDNIKDFHTVNVVIGFTNIKFDSFGKYSIQITVGDFYKELYFYVNKSI
jgi:hypothetical protein